MSERERLIELLKEIKYHPEKKPARNMKIMNAEIANILWATENVIFTQGMLIIFLQTMSSYHLARWVMWCPYKTNFSLKNGRVIGYIQDTENPDVSEYYLADHPTEKGGVQE